MSFMTRENTQQHESQGRLWRKKIELSGSVVNIKTIKENGFQI
jgi:hypothetical protein